MWGDVLLSLCVRGELEGGGPLAVPNFLKSEQRVYCNLVETSVHPR